MEIINGVPVIGGGGSGLPAQLADHLLPFADGVYDLGDSTHGWRRLEMSGGAGSYVSAPVLTEAQRDALTPAAGMVVYNSDQSALQYYNGTGWAAAAGDYLPLAGGTMTDNIVFATLKGILATNTDANVVIFQARDSGVGLVNVARLVGAADPYFEATLPMLLNPSAQPGTPVEGHFLYNSTKDVPEFYGGGMFQAMRETELAVSGSIDLKAVADTTLFTVPAGKSAVITQVIWEGVLANANSGSPVISVGGNAPNYNDYDTDTLNSSELDGPGTYMIWRPQAVKTEYASYAAATVIKARVSTAGGGTTWSVRCRVFGYLI